MLFDWVMSKNVILKMSKTAQNCHFIAKNQLKTVDLFRPKIYFDFLLISSLFCENSDWWIAHGAWLWSSDCDSCSSLLLAAFSQPAMTVTYGAWLPTNHSFFWFFKLGRHAHDKSTHKFVKLLWEQFLDLDPWLSPDLHLIIIWLTADSPCPYTIYRDLSEVYKLRNSWKELRDDAESKYILDFHFILVWL